MNSYVTPTKARESKKVVMPGYTNFVLAQCQATLFTPEAEVSSARLLSRLLPRWADVFDGEPIVMPLPDGIPKEIPRAILQSRSGEWRCECASGRLNLYWKQPSPTAPGQSLQAIYRRFIPLLEQYFEFIDSRVGRLAGVVNRYSIHESPGRFLAAHFCKERWLKAPFNRPENFELHAHKKFQMAAFEVNSWVRNRTGILAAEGTGQAIILVEQDLNTLAEQQDQRAFPMNEIRGFFEAAVHSFDEILALYYPSHDD